MFRRLPLWIVALFVPLDFAAVFAAGIVAWAFRFHPIVQGIKPVVFRLSFAEYMPLVVFVAALNTCVVAFLGLYKTRQDLRFWEILLRLLFATAVTFAAITWVIFLRQELFDSRFLVVAGWFLAALFLMCGRVGARLALDALSGRLRFVSLNILLIGSDAISAKLARRLGDAQGKGIRLVAHVAAPDRAVIEQIAQQHALDEILLGDPDYPREKILDLIEFAHERHIRFSFVPNLFQSLTANAMPAVIGEVPLVELRRTPLEGWGHIMKRAFDIVGSLGAILLFSPLAALIAAAIKLDSKGPVFYRSKRASPHGAFMMFKFRTMKLEYCTGGEYPNALAAEQVENDLIASRNVREGPVPKVLNDPRRTRLGRFLERTSLDELPQFLNALKGEMSLVGPRPHVPKEVERYERRHRRVFTLKPGITGLAQISGRSDLDFDDEVALDLHYIEHWSIWLDLMILLKTPFAVLFKKHRS